MEIKENYLTPNPFSRPGTPLNGVKGIVLHWVANPKTTAIQNRNYFEALKNQMGDIALSKTTFEDLKCYAIRHGVAL